MTRDLVHLVSDGVRATFATTDGLPELVHVGSSNDPAPGHVLFEGSIPPAGLDDPAAPSLVVDPGRGWFGQPGIVVSRGGSPVVLDPASCTGESDGTSATFSVEDRANGVRIDAGAAIGRGGVLVLSANVVNTGTSDLKVHDLRITVPVPERLGTLLTYGGRHAMEFCEERTTWGRSVQSVSSRRGRTSHQHAPTVVCVEPGTDGSRGGAWMVHLAWSGNFEIVCDSVTADRRTVTAGELLAPGEIVLAPGGSYSTPDVLVAVSDDGIDAATAAMHAHLRSLSPATRTPRPVVVNTWEAVYFDHDHERLFELARRAARVGAERFVLDDGWFKGRRDDTAGLGDWTVDPDVWPDGLSSLAGHVTGLGMEFGIWVEPEMVNPDSDLHRAHPEWVLGATRRVPLVGRNQLVLDMSRRDVRDHLFDRISALLSSLPVTYVKWDHNRDVVAHGSHAQTTGTYELIDRLRASHPGVEFESCASGGGRIDAGMATRTVRFWTSDSIDALDRLSIQRGALRVVPPEMLGAHIGAPVCHTTGRRHPLAFRALSALPFWMGIEWDLLSATDHDLDRLAEVVEVHKKHRALLHSGTTHLDGHPDPLVHQHVVVSPTADEALVVVARLGSGPRHVAAPLRIRGLDPTGTYRCSVVPLGPHRWALHRGLPSWVVDGIEETGASLARIGLPFPPLLPESGILVHVERTR